MTIACTKSNDGHNVTITVSGKFDFQLYDEFRSSYSDVSEGGSVQYSVDLGSTDYMDSSALGMLLLLREHGGGDNAKIEIVNASTEVTKILEVANFSKLFSIK